MGAGIAQVALTAGHPTVLFDVSESALRTGVERINRFVLRAVEKGATTEDEAEAALLNLKASTDLVDLAPCGVAVEAAPERLDLKQRIFADLENTVGADALLATNTSTLSVAAIFRDCLWPARTIGMHFFNPAPLMPLVEVVRGPATAPETVERSLALVRSWGKQPVLAADAPGFIVNRVARPFYGEALRMLGDGRADVATLDRVLRDAGFPMGPFELMDLIGIDVNLAAAESVFDGFFGDPRFRPHPIQRQMVDSGRLGRKSGRGYYDYDARGEGER